MPTKYRLSALLLACVLSGHAAAQQEPSEVTDNEITKYRTVAESACRDSGKQRGDPEDQVTAFCSCLMTHLVKDMSRVEWQQVYFYSLKKQGEEEQKVLVPHLKTFRGCAAPDAPQGAAPGTATPAPGAATAAPAKKPGTGLRPPPSK
jgi:hypothetical protein